MEFNRRVTDHTPPLPTFTPSRPPPPPPGFSYFPNQSMPGHMGRVLTDSYKLEGPNSAIEMSEFIRRELEIGKIREEVIQSVLTQIQKERIMDEIIVDEILRRRFLKADVERELSIERKLALPGLSPHEIVGRPRLSLPHEMVGRPRGALPHEMVGRPRGSLPHEMVGRPRGSLPHEMVGRPIGESCATSLDGGLGMSSEFRREFGCLGTGLHMNAEPNVLDDKLQLGLENLEEEIVWTPKPLRDVTQLQKGYQNTLAMKVNKDLIVPKKGGNDGDNSVSADTSAVVPKVEVEGHPKEEANVGAEISTENLAKSLQLDDYVQPSGTPIEGNQEHKKNSFTFWCDMCQMGTNSEYNMEIHRAGKKHHLAQKKRLLTFCCDVCQIGTNTKNGMDKHKAGSKHHLAQKKQLFRFWCDLCQIGTDTEDMMEKHKAGIKHHLAQKKQFFQCWCDVCQIGTNSETVMEMHKAGKKHLANKKQLFRFWCDECQIGTDNENVMEKHKAGNKHLSRLQEINQNLGDKPPSLVMLPIKEAEINSLDLKNSYELLNNLSLSSDVSMKKDEAPVQRAKETRGLEKNSFKFWCDICQLGADSEEVLKNHKYGKKHQAQLQKCSSSTGGDKR